MLIAVIGVCAVFEKPSSMSKYVKKRETEERYCGSKLADKLREVCNAKYEGLDDIYEGVDNTDGVNNTYDGVNNTRKRGTNFFHRRPPQGVAKFVFRFLNDFTLIVKITWQRVKRTCKIKVTHQILKIIHFAQTPRYFSKTHSTNNLI